MRKQLENQKEKPNHKREQLNEAFIYEKSISKSVYDEQLFKIGSDSESVNMELYALMAYNLDIEALVNFPCDVIERSDELWKEIEPGPKTQLQKVLYPEGIGFNG